ncbi:MAG: hypothetical protein JSW06_07945 [Thermoplasmatales archaeon]|nr:MAG: hypothetical protein JSW06_07945 [Thermoplasmatales archaeon]
MKIKILGIMTCMILMLSISSVAEPIEIKQISNETIMINDDVPSWNKDDSWTYRLDEINIDYNVGGQKIFMDGNIDDFKWAVTDTSGSNYKVDFRGKPTAEYEIRLPLSSMTLGINGTFKSALTRITGTITFTKSDLEIVDISAEIKGISVAKIYPIPIPLPIPFKLTFETDFNKDIPIFDFPLVEPTQSWFILNLNANMDLTIGGIFGLIKIPINFNSNYPLVIFECEGKQDIAVAAGIFSAYRIRPIIGDFFEYYYAPSVGNLVKIEFNMPNGNIRGELISTNRL